MYLSLVQCDRLSEICNRVEVALRSYVADIIINEFKKEDFIKNLMQIANSYKVPAACTPINTAKFSAKASSLAKANIYECIENAKRSYESIDVIKGDVLTVGNLTALIALFYNPLFTELGSKYDSHEQFIESLNMYHHNVRNRLSHIASAKINEKDVQRVLALFTALLAQIEDKYFWFSSKLEINDLIEKLMDSLKEAIPVTNNLEVATKKHNHLILRENEMRELSNIICGDEIFRRVAGSVELHGYGGVGKSALALEFCYEIIRNEMNNRKLGYNFILWLSTKSEELAYQWSTGSIYIKETKASYKNCDDIISQLKKLLELESSTSKEELLNLIMGKNYKGIIVLDNLETINAYEREKIKGLIREFPRSVQFVITSRNYENIAEANLLVKGYSNIELGKQFIHEYIKINGFENIVEENKLEVLLRQSFGNTLILVLGLNRIIDGTSSLDSIIGELEVYDGSEIEIIVDFMYKNTFDTTIKEIETEIPDFNIHELLTIMLMYDERIDFHSLRELLNYRNVKNLNLVLEKLTSRFVVNKNKGYYELHEFAEKFIILKMLPGAIKFKELQDKIYDYKKFLKESLKRLYEDKQNYAKLVPIFEDWKPATEAEIIAIAHAYNQYKDIKDQLKKNIGDRNKILKKTKENFEKFEIRSNHPYIKFQKARVLSIFRNSSSKTERDLIDQEIATIFEETHFSINFRHKYISKTESYVAFLWIFGIYLTITNRYFDAVRVLEESVERLSGLNSLRNKAMPAQIYMILSEVYAQLYLITKDYGYISTLNNTLNKVTNISRRDQIIKMKLLRLFYDVHSGTLRGEIGHAKLKRMPQIPVYLNEIYRSIENKVLS